MFECALQLYEFYDAIEIICSDEENEYGSDILRAKVNHSMKTMPTRLKIQLALIADSCYQILTSIHFLEGRILTFLYLVYYIFYLFICSYNHYISSILITLKNI